MRLPRRPHASTILLIAVAVLILADVALAADVAAAEPADPADIVAPLLDNAGPAGLVVAGLVGIWREVRGEMARHEAARATLSAEIALLRRDLDRLTLETSHRLERAADALASVRSALEDLK
jgi:hypothetical protein